MDAKKTKTNKRYAVIVKVGAVDFKKWRTNDLLKFVIFLDKNHAKWRYFNVFCTKTKLQIASYTSKSRPTEKHV